MRLKFILASCITLATLIISCSKLPAYECDCPRACCDETPHYDPCCEGTPSYQPCFPCNPCSCDTPSYNFSCPWDPCCDGTPYDEGKWSISAYGAVTPTWFADRGSTLVFDRITPTTFLLPDSGTLAKFNTLFRTPWTLGVELGYMICKNWEVFSDFEYTTAGGCRRSFLDVDGSTVSESLPRYRTLNWYLGSRYYLPPFWCNFTPFIGAKAGAVYRYNIRADIVRTGVVAGTFFNEFSPGYTVSGGLQLGVNWDLSSCLVLTLKAEAVWLGGWRTNFRDEGAPSGPIVVLGDIGPLFSVPVSIGLRISF